MYCVVSSNSTEYNALQGIFSYNNFVKNSINSQLFNLSNLIKNNIPMANSNCNIADLKLYIHSIIHI